MRRRRDSNSLAGQVVAANVLMVVATLFAASAMTHLNLRIEDQRVQFGLLGLSIALVLLVNMLMLRRRFSPLDRLIDRLEALHLSAPPGTEEALAELKRLVNQAMDELLRLARQLRPAALDDHGLTSAIVSQVRRFSSQTGIRAEVKAHGERMELEPDQE